MDLDGCVVLVFSPDPKKTHRGSCTAPRNRTALLIHNYVACVLVLGNHDASAKAILDPLAGFDVSAKVLSLYMIGYDAT